MPVIALFADGGVVRKNPSPLGGTWAWCHVDDAGESVEHQSGIVTPAEVGTPAVSNNQTELIAVVRGLAELPPGWRGTVYTDSYVTLCRITKGERFEGIAAELEREARQLRRSRTFAVVLLGGHPTRLDLARGRRADGLPVSPHNVFCDKACTRQAQEFLARRAAAEVTA